MKINKHFIVGILSLLSIFSIHAQQDPQFTQYFDNTLFVNPAYAGSTGMLSATGIHREQWVGFAGRPSSTTFSIHSPLSYQSVGTGLTVVSDVIGPFRQILCYGDFSYSLRFKNKSKLSFGWKGGANFVSIGSSTLATIQNGDPNLINDTRNFVNPNFGVGLYYRASNWFIGASTPKLIEKSYDRTTTNIEKRHYFGIAGAIITLNNKWKLRPTTQFKIAVGAPTSIDLSLTGIYKEKLYLGSMYRLNAAFGVFVQVQATQQLRIGLATEFGTTAIKKYNSGTFEFLLSYDFSFSKQGVKSPRYF